MFLSKQHDQTRRMENIVGASVSEQCKTALSAGPPQREIFCQMKPCMALTLSSLKWTGKLSCWHSTHAEAKNTHRQTM